MRIQLATATTILALATVSAMPVAAAAPDCVNTGPRTTQCETGGSTQIVTSPQEVLPYSGWGYGYGYGGGLLIGFGF
ncbi:hypothetical protein AU194_18480 [Mycobacterium sp. GA-2829]|nr:hypothetical protein AU194_18480 [Mycobacterium sp. GA-2829]